MAVIFIGPSLETVLTPNNPWWLAEPIRDCEPGSDNETLPASTD